MSGNGRGNMRPTSRSPPFLVIGLLVAMCILAFNYWNLSSKNGDLSRQLETLQVDFRTVSDKHLTVEKRAADLASQLSESQTKQNQLQSSLAEKEVKLSELNGEVETLRGQLQTATESLVSFFLFSFLFLFVCLLVFKGLSFGVCNIAFRIKSYECNSSSAILLELRNLDDRRKHEATPLLLRLQGC